MKDPETFTKFGKFTVAPGKEVYGELRVAGKESSLYVQDDDYFHDLSPANGCITGTLHDLTKVTLFQCARLKRGGSVSRDGQQYYYAKLFPHFVLEGQRHIAPTDESISQITFVPADAPVLFYDVDAFGTVIDSAPYIEQIVAANQLARPVPIGPEPQIAYFTGQRDIVQADTALGQVRVRHNPSWGLGGPHGVRIDNIISVTLEPPSPITFDEATTRTLRLLRFLALIIGRPQSLRELVIFVNGGEHPEPLKVHWSDSPACAVDTAGDTSSPRPADLLLDPICRQHEFVSVMRAWLEKDEERQDARARFHRSFAHQDTYTVDRLIGAANMFDILPRSAVPRDVELPRDLQEAKQQCRRIFRSLPDSYERSSILNALGRIGMASLKHKTRHRAQYLVPTLEEWFPEIVRVLDAAIDCRNHYVHGSPSKIDYSENNDMVIFFTDTLEFVFGTSELVEAGWDIQAFVERPTSMSHPYGAYRVNYPLNLQAFRALVERS
jgi:hypothetical protein